jgi:hypothetical protein
MIRILTLAAVLAATATAAHAQSTSTSPWPTTSGVIDPEEGVPGYKRKYMPPDGYDGWLPPEARIAATIKPPSLVPPSWKQVDPAAPVETVVIRYGQGGAVAAHQLQYAYYRRAKAKVEVRGPCYSACTMLTTYVEPDNLCIAPGAFMAFHAVRMLEDNRYLAHETWLFYLNLPQPIRLWINSKGGWQALPLDGYWTMYDRELWAMGYPRCR